MHNNGKDKTSIKEDLNRLSRAYAALKPDEPPHILDQTILNSARRAVAQKPRWLQFGWPHGLATAAIVVLTLSIITEQYPPSVLDPIALPEQEAVILDQAHVERQLEPVPEPAQKPPAIIPAAKPTAKKSQEYREKKARVQESIFIKEVQAPTQVPAEKTESDRRVATIGASNNLESSRVTTIQEQRLDAILMLKYAGDDAWKTKLLAFTRDFPDYPLPAVLKDKDQIP